MFDLSYSGEKKFYEEWFRGTESIIKNSHEGDINFKETMSSRIEQLKSYASKRNV